MEPSHGFSEVGHEKNVLIKIIVGSINAIGISKPFQADLDVLALKHHIIARAQNRKLSKAPVINELPKSPGKIIVKKMAHKFAKKYPATPAAIDLEIIECLENVMCCSACRAEIV